MAKKKAGKKKASKRKSKGIAATKVKKEKKRSDGKRITCWMSSSLKKLVEKKYPKQSFSHSVAEGLQLLLKKAK